MVEPLLLTIGLEILKVVGAALVSSLTVFIAMYAKKYERRFQRNEVQGEIDRYTRWANEMQAFRLLGVEEKKQTIKEAVEQFVLENNISITESELNLMIERALLLPKAFRNLLLSRMEEHNGLEIDSIE